MTGSTVVDAVVIGAGPNGLVGAIDLADHGWDVLVLEAQPEPGGAVRSDEQLGSGVVTDRFSAFYPLAAASPHIARLGLERHGLAWAYAPLVLAHPVLDHPAAVLSRNIERTAASFDRFHQGDGDAWRRHHDDWRRLGDHIVRTVMDPMPPVRAAAGLLARTGIRGAADLARTALLTTRRLGEEWFDGDGARLLITGTALHGDLTPDNASGGFFGWLLAAIGQEDGWPVPRGGSGSLTAALVRRLVHAGGVVECNAPVTRIEIIDGRAVAVVTADGRRIVARRAVLADVGAPQLFGGLVAPEALPRGASAGMRRYQPGLATFKVNWLIDGGVPWSDPDVASAGTVHIARSLEELTLGAAHIASRHLPADPFVLIGQMTTSDPSRSPPGTESVWAYTSIPQRIVGDVAGEIDDIDEPGDAQRFADRLQARIEAYAPGFTSRIRARTIQTPASIERADANLQRGDKSLGTAQLHQQLVFRPTLGLGRAETGIAGLYLASAAAHPGGGVHGACGANAARAAIAGDRRRSLTSLGRRPR